MKGLKFAIGVLAILCLALGIYLVLSDEKALLIHPKGIIARKELDLIVRALFLMLIVIVPTFIALYVVAWKYRDKSGKGQYDPDHSTGKWGEAILWIVPTVVIGALSVILWYAAHDLDPYRPLDSDVEPVNIQVIAMDWKWLFIYPDHGVASLNFVQFPEKTPINFKLAADDSPMNSFWLPELSGQIYCMTGMVTPLHMMADGPGVYSGRAAEINGKGLADMTFIAKSSTRSEFDNWIAQAKQASQSLTRDFYENQLLQPTTNLPVTLYSSVEEGLFDHVVMKYMHPAHDHDE
jgi:cytochrome o ubiquinol oxidase subunit 2